MLSKTQVVPSLQEVQQQFDAWRANKNGSRRIPENLWLRVPILLQHYSLHMIRKALRLSSTQLKEKNLLPIKNKKTPKSKKISTSFFELSMPSASMMPTLSATPALTLKRGELTLSFKNPTHDHVQLFINALRG